MDKLFVGVHGDGQYKGGMYNVLASFNVGVLKAFQKCGISADNNINYFNKNMVPALSIGFNVFGHEYWKTLLDMGITNIMWNVDSIFYQNLNVVQQYKDYPNFVLFSVTPCDEEPIKHYLPGTNYIYMPHGVDPELWKPQNCEKEYDIVFLSSIRDYNKVLAELKAQTTPQVFNVVMALYNYAMEHPEQSLWEIYQVFHKTYGLTLDLPLFHNLFHTLCYAITHKKRVELIKKLKNFNVKVWGSELWEKHIEGNVEYMGKADLTQSIDIINKSKIVLHLHPHQLCRGLHERVLNASSTGSFVISDDITTIKESFDDNFGYYRNTNYENIEDLVSYYLKNNEEREAKALQAQRITLENHTWENRVKKILELIILK